jgi:hypothetical protein
VWLNSGYFDRNSKEFEVRAEFVPSEEVWEFGDRPPSMILVLEARLDLIYRNLYID